MNDRYLFKAKTVAHKGCENSGEWVIGCLLVNESSTDVFKYRIQQIESSQLFAPPIDPFTLCQCTGLKDKNALIWENDIVYARCNGLSGKGVVKFENGCFVLKDRKRNRTYSLFGEWKFRVDGNIFDNPELLEVE